MDTGLRIRDFVAAIGSLPAGPRNSIADVAGVAVGQRSLVEGAIRTGVTVLLPHCDNLYRQKVVAASCVLNGFGKSVGLIQIDELGTIETPIAFTNTFGVGTCANALIRHAVAGNPDIGRTTATVNPVVLECNDGYLNDIQAMALREADVAEAIAAAGPELEQGAVGAGTGMSAFGLKGGMGSASRRLTLDGRPHVLGALVQANFGRRDDLRIDGRAIATAGGPDQRDAGSICIALATDIPLDSRQLRRVARRAVVGLARVGSFLGHGSGDIVVAFTTANRLHHDERRDLVPLTVLNESRIDPLFRAAAEAVEEAILNAMVAAPAMEGRAGRRQSLADLLRQMGYPARG